MRLRWAKAHGIKSLSANIHHIPTLPYPYPHTYERKREREKRGKERRRRRRRERKKKAYEAKIQPLEASSS